MSTTDQMGEFITLEEGSQMTARYRASIQPGETIAVAVSSDILTRILQQENCTGLRMYFAMDESGAKTLVMVGIDEQTNDMAQGLIANKLRKSPPWNILPNDLNS
jgi:hypothetical protein